MHLELLYKYVPFLNKDKIGAVLPEYQRNKELKMKEEEERQQMQNQMRKMRGRASSKKERKDECSLDKLEKPEQDNQLIDNLNEVKTDKKKLLVKKPSKVDPEMNDILEDNLESSLPGNSNSNESSTITLLSDRSNKSASASKLIKNNSVLRKVLKNI